MSYLSDVIKEYGGQEKEDSHKEWRELNPTTIEELLLQERWKIISSFMSSVLFEELLCKACGAKDNKHCDRWDCPTLLDKS